MNKKIDIKISAAPRAEIQRQENVGDCFKKPDNKHFYLVRDADVLHVGNTIINTLFDNAITDDRINRDQKYVPIKRSEFNQRLNEVIFELNIFAKEFKTN